MQPIRMMIEIPGDREAVRGFLLQLAPRLEARQPGVTEQIRVADLGQPMQMATPDGTRIGIHIEPREDRSAIKVSVDPPYNLSGKWRTAFWRWRTRMVLRWTLKGVRKAIAKQAKS